MDANLKKAAFVHAKYPIPPNKRSEGILAGRELVSRHEVSWVRTLGFRLGLDLGVGSWKERNCVL